MNHTLHVDDVVAAPPSTTLRILRGARRHCPRCGSGGLFRHWFRLRDNCPGCGYRFAREEDFFIGAYTVNLIVTLTATFLVLMSTVLFVAANQAVPVPGMVVAGIATSVVLPIAFYPVSFTLWAALDLSSDPLELDEISDAVDALQGARGPETNGDLDSGPQLS